MQSTNAASVASAPFHPQRPASQHIYMPPSQPPRPPQPLQPHPMHHRGQSGLPPSAFPPHRHHHHAPADYAAYPHQSPASALRGTPHVYPEQQRPPLPPLHPGFRPPSSSPVSAPPPAPVVIIHTDLVNSPIVRQLSQTQLDPASVQYNVKVSATIPESTLLFARASTAFRVVSSLPSLFQARSSNSANFQLSEAAKENLQGVARLFPSAFLVVFLLPNDPQQAKMMDALQQELVTESVTILPALSVPDAVRAMQRLAKMLTPPDSTTVAQRFLDFHSQHQRQRQRQPEASEFVVSLLRAMGLSAHDIGPGQGDARQHPGNIGLGTIQAVACASFEELLECSLDARTARKVMAYFAADATPEF